MTAPSYTTDLQLITEAESTDNWSALGGGQAGLSAETDFFIQNTYCVSKQISNALKGMIYNYGSQITPVINTHFFVWLYSTTPGLLDTLQNGGMRVTIGTGTGDYNEFHVKGKTEYIYGGWLCFPIRYRTDETGSPPYRTKTGTPGDNPQYFGGQLKTINSIKGINLGIDVIRYGTGIYITDGEVGNVANFVNAAAQNDSQNNRWGVLMSQAGGYALQGRFVIGQDNSYNPAAARFEASNAMIVLTDTPHTLSDFTQIIIDHASTVFNLTNITILALGINNPGKLIFNNASTISALTGCTFANIGITILRAGVTANGCTWRNSALITQNSAILTGCVFNGTQDTEKQLMTDDLGKISNCQFISPGTGHAIRIDIPGTYTFSGNTFSGFGANGTTDACIYNNSGGLVKILLGASEQPTIRNGSGATTEFPTSVTLTMTVKDEVGEPIVGAFAYIDDDDQTPYIMNTTTNESGIATIGYEGEAVQSSRWRVRKYGYKNFKQLIDISGSNINLPITLIADPQQN